MANERAVKMIERRDTLDFLFLNAGDMLEGLLVERKAITINSRPFIQYTVDDNGQLYSFLGRRQIDDKTQNGDVGKRLRISYQGQGTTVVNGIRVGVFRVFISASPVNNSQHVRARDGKK